MTTPGFSKNEEESDFNKIEVRDEFYYAIVKGYCGEMKEVMTSHELDAIFYSGLFMIYVQAIRFLTDHLLGDPYYGAKYEGHNLVRANKNNLYLKGRQTQSCKHNLLTKSAKSCRSNYRDSKPF